MTKKEAWLQIKEIGGRSQSFLAQPVQENPGSISFLLDFPDCPFYGFSCSSWLLNTQFQD
jgi:hypothetical protein